MVPPPENDIESIIKAPPAVGAGMKHHDVWPGFGSSVDPSRVDRVQQALRTKVETSNSFDDPHRAVKKLFADASGTAKSNSLDEDEFVKLMVGKLNFSGYDVDVRALFKRFDIDHTGKLDVDEFCSMLFNEPGSRATTAIGKVRDLNQASGRSKQLEEPWRPVLTVGLRQNWRSLSFRVGARFG
jgi:hypothetical protein